jgi:hypothetical protein
VWHNTPSRAKREGSHSGLVRAPAKRLLRAKSGSRVRIPLPPPEGQGNDLDGRLRQLQTGVCLQPSCARHLPIFLCFPVVGVTRAKPQLSHNLKLEFIRLWLHRHHCNPEFLSGCFRSLLDSCLHQAAYSPFPSFQLQHRCAPAVPYRKAG